MAYALTPEQIASITMPELAFSTERLFGVGGHSRRLQAREHLHRAGFGDLLWHGYAPQHHRAERGR